MNRNISPNENDANTRSTDPLSSFAAAERVRPKLKGHFQTIMSCLGDGEPKTNNEISMESMYHGRPLDRYQVARRMSELESKNLVVRGRKICSKLGEETTSWMSNEFA